MVTPHTMGGKTLRIALWGSEEITRGMRPHRAAAPCSHCLSVAAGQRQQSEAGMGQLYKTEPQGMPWEGPATSKITPLNHTNHT